ncbi:hypothetical protein JTB14_004776 [Gonioctena quinquepunctata]|nr:hypothetical protein JTB14_004776 [Gonioctena quinquepunctata]
MREEKNRIKTKTQQVKRKITGETGKSDHFEQHNAGCSKSHLKRKVSLRNTKKRVFDDSDPEGENEKDPFYDEDDDAACIY